MNAFDMCIDDNQSSYDAGRLINGMIFEDRIPKGVAIWDAARDMRSGMVFPLE